MMPVEEFTHYNNFEVLGLEELDVIDFDGFLATACGLQRSQTEPENNGIRERSGHVEISQSVPNEDGDDWRRGFSMDLLKVPHDPFVASVMGGQIHDLMGGQTHDLMGGQAQDSPIAIDRQLSNFTLLTMVDDSARGPIEAESTTGKLKSRKRSRETTPAPRKRKAASDDVERDDITNYVQMCRLFGRSGNHLNEDFLRSLMHTLFETEATNWEAQLNSSRRASFIEDMCKSGDILVKGLFCFLSFVDFLKTQEGKVAWDKRKENFESSFQGSIYRVLTDKDAHSDETFRRNPELMRSLYDSHACLLFLVKKRGMRLWRNLCFFLMIVSCIEGRGVYHGRTSNGLSMPHKCYRYMIEKLGGRDYRSETDKQLGQAGRELVATFE